ncbi:MAG: SDR family NAD(P)-dependent oxidoreductase, partial [Flavobacteriales bacterium]|nr:SDR family NAD(P)-dependent oxidoreductase [Flavobacteriales bacterium]
MRNFKDKLCIVTGASGGLGKAISEQIIERGGIVVGLDLNDEHINKVATALGDNFHPFSCDITDLEKSRSIFKEIKKIGQVYALFNNAGITNVDLFSEEVIDPLK